MITESWRGGMFMRVEWRNCIRLNWVGERAASEQTVPSCAILITDGHVHLHKAHMK